MAEATLQEYLDLSPAQIRIQLMAILERDLPLPGKRQGSFNAVEILLCYGLFSLVDPHH
jgi:putative restriction endonuclease